MKTEKIKYKVMDKTGKVKSYVDKRWCYCSDYPTAHIHPNREKK